MSGLPAKPSSCSTAISTGRPWQSQPARRGTCQPCMGLNRGKTSLNARASMWWGPGGPFAGGGARAAVGRGRTLIEVPLRLARRALQRPGEDLPVLPAPQDLLLEGGQVDLRGQGREGAGRTRSTHAPIVPESTTGFAQAGLACPMARYRFLDGMGDVVA